MDLPDKENSASRLPLEFNRSSFLDIQPASSPYKFRITPSLHNHESQFYSLSLFKPPRCVCMCVHTHPALFCFSRETSLIQEHKELTYKITLRRRKNSYNKEQVIFRKPIMETFPELIKMVTLQIQELYTSRVKRKKATPQNMVVECRTPKRRRRS